MYNCRLCDKGDEGDNFTNFIKRLEDQMGKVMEELGPDQQLTLMDEGGAKPKTELDANWTKARQRHSP